MKDTKNLKKKLKECKNDLKFALVSGDHYGVNWNNNQISFIEKQIESRKKNKIKNQKEFKKSNGYNKK